MRYVVLLLLDLRVRVLASSLPLIFHNSGGLRNRKFGGGRLAKRWGWLEAVIRGPKVMETVGPSHGRGIAATELGEKEVMAAAGGGKEAAAGTLRRGGGRWHG